MIQIAINRSFREHFWGDKINIGFMASGSGTNFAVVAEMIATGYLNAKIAVLVCNKPEAKVLQRAGKYNIKTAYVDHRSFSRSDLDYQIIDIMRQNNVDLIVMGGWMRIVTSVLVSEYQDKMINIHPSYLPDFPGYDAIGDAINAGVSETGVTTHIVDEEVDHGRILLQEKVCINDGNTREILRKRMQIVEHKILPETIMRYSKF